MNFTLASITLLSYRIIKKKTIPVRFVLQQFLLNNDYIKFFLEQIQLGGKGRSLLSISNR